MSTRYGQLSRESNTKTQFCSHFFVLLMPSWPRRDGGHHKTVFTLHHGSPFPCSAQPATNTLTLYIILSFPAQQPVCRRGIAHTTLFLHTHSKTSLCIMTPPLRARSPTSDMKPVIGPLDATRQRCDRTHNRHHFLLSTAAAHFGPDTCFCTAPMPSLRLFHLSLAAHHSVFTMYVYEAGQKSRERAKLISSFLCCQAVSFERFMRRFVNCIWTLLLHRDASLKSWRQPPQLTMPLSARLLVTRALATGPLTSIGNCNTSSSMWDEEEIENAAAPSR